MELIGGLTAAWIAGLSVAGKALAILIGVGILGKLFESARGE